VKATIAIETDEPVMVLVVPLPLCKCRQLPADTRRIVDTTAEPAPTNVVQLRRTA
jgi:hypothetical protein